MKKIKLFTPIIGTALVTASAIPLAACSKPAVGPIDREIQIDSSIANTVEVIKKELTSDGDLNIRLQEKTQILIDKLTSVKIGSVTLDNTLYSFVNNVLSIKKKAFDATGKIIIAFNVVEAEEVELKYDGHSYSTIQSLESTKTYKFTVKYEADIKHTDVEFMLSNSSSILLNVIVDGSFKCVTTDSTPLTFVYTPEAYRCYEFKNSIKQTLTFSCKFRQNLPGDTDTSFTYST